MTTSEDAVLIDTNVLVYAADRSSAFYSESRSFRDRGRSGACIPCVTPQILFEFCAVVTDPRRVGRPLSPEDATAELAQYFSDPRIRKIHPGDEIGEAVLKLLRKYAIRCQDVFDAAIAAAMIANGIRKICTYDTAHFSRFSEIEVLRPSA
jgi:hypothetical protein